ncbi:MAG: rhodanese-like domain-containing protein [Pseudodonghicola sp.]|nr:rhodanese-like domain-containing protein [Pseudodonghicola sp.]
MPVSISIRDLLARGLHWPHRAWALFDLREAGEFAAGHIFGATSLPRRLLEFRLSELLPDPSWPVVVYDRGAGDGRAKLAALRLAEMGVADVAVLHGGIAAWVDAGQVLASGLNVPSKTFGENVLHETRIQTVTPEELYGVNQSAGSVAICDVRTSGEFAAHHLPGACSLPGFELAAHLPGLTRDHDRVVLNCAGRTRSIIAAATAQALGFDCPAVENGTMGWRLAGYPVEGGAVAPPSAPSPEDAMAIADHACLLALQLGVDAITAAELARLGGSSGPQRPYIVDVRAQDAFLAGHVPSALWLPGGQAIQRTDDFLAVPGAPVVVIDEGDARAWLAAWWLRRMGFPSVHVLDGGMPTWRDAGFKVETGRGRRRPELVEKAAEGAPLLGLEDMRARLERVPLPLLFDVGTSRGFARAHLPNAIWLPRGWLEARIGDYAAPEDEIVLTASDPSQAILAAATLQDMGYARARACAVSPADWARAGGAVETGPPPDTAEDIVDPPYEMGLQAMRDYLEWEIRLTAGADASGQGATSLKRE